MHVRANYHAQDSRMCAFNWKPLPPHGEDEWWSFQFFTDKAEYIGYVLVFKTKWGFWETHTEITNEKERGTISRSFTIMDETEYGNHDDCEKGSISPNVANVTCRNYLTAVRDTI